MSSNERESAKDSIPSYCKKIFIAQEHISLSFSKGKGNTLIPVISYLIKKVNILLEKQF
jgi:hypothetical protein